MSAGYSRIPADLSVNLCNVLWEQDLAKLCNLWNNNNLTLNFTGYLLVFAIIISIFSTCPSIAQAEEGQPKKASSDYVAELRYGSINWTTGVIRVNGKSSPTNRELTTIDDSFMIKSAKNSAREHLLEILYTIGLPGKPVSFNATHSDHQAIPYTAKIMPSIHTRIAQMKKQAMNAKVVDISRISGKSAEVILETTIYGDFLQSILPSQIDEIPNIELFEPENQYQDSDISQGFSHTDKGINNTADWIWQSKAVHRNGSYTGLIIDARGIEFKPVICPVVISEQGEEIYSPVFISREYAVERGVCSYVCSLDPSDLAILQKAGNNPVIVKGLRKESDRNYCIVISMSDADKIQRIPERHQFMKGCRVVIVLSKPE